VKGFYSSYVIFEDVVWDFLHHFWKSYMDWIALEYVSVGNWTPLPWDAGQRLTWAQAQGSCSTLSKALPTSEENLCSLKHVWFGYNKQNVQLLSARHCLQSIWQSLAFHSSWELVSGSKRLQWYQCLSYFQEKKRFLKHWLKADLCS